MNILAKSRAAPMSPESSASAPTPNSAPAAFAPASYPLGIAKPASGGKASIPASYPLGIAPKTPAAAKPAVVTEVPELTRRRRFLARKR